jgi:signal transduction histidine kinase
MTTYNSTGNSIHTPVQPLHPLEATKPAATFATETGASTTPNSRWGRTLEAMRRHPERTDLVVTLGFTLTMIASLVAGWFTLTKTERLDVSWWAFPLASIGMTTFWYRRKAPELQFLLLTVCVVVAGAGNAPDGVVSFIGVWIALYGVGAYGGRYRNHVRALSAVLLIGTLYWFWRIDAQTTPTGIRGPELLFVLAMSASFVASAWLFGDTMRIKRAQAHDLALRAAELEVERDRNADQAVTEERLRIARELHDVLAHHVTLIGIHATAADRTLDRDPKAAKQALATIANASRETVDELQRLLWFLRTPLEVAAEEAQPAAPQPSLANLDRLLDDVRNGGQFVSVQTSGDILALPGSVSLSAYRIVQEALTNTLRHAPGAHAKVGINVGEGWVSLDIENDRPAPAPNVAPLPLGGKHGVIGMRERARLVGGTLTTGPTVSGGWFVSAKLPITPTPILEMQT